jgi:hypothetical protein
LHNKRKKNRKGYRQLAAQKLSCVLFVVSSSGCVVFSPLLILTYTDAISNYMAHLLHFRPEMLMTGSLEALLQISEEAGKAKLGSQISPDKLQMSEEAEAEVEPAIETSKQADGA